MIKDGLKLQISPMFVTNLQYNLEIDQFFSINLIHITHSYQLASNFTPFLDQLSVVRPVNQAHYRRWSGYFGTHMETMNINLLDPTFLFISIYCVSSKHIGSPPNDKS